MLRGYHLRTPYVTLFVLLLVLKDKGYTTLQDEAIKIFNSLQQLESMSDPIPIIQGILQTGHDLRPLRDELYCQLIKQTNKVPHPGSVGNLCSWQILTCLSCTFLPSRGILKYLKFHLRRYEVAWAVLLTSGVQWSAAPITQTPNRRRLGWVSLLGHLSSLAGADDLCVSKPRGAGPGTRSL